MDDPELSAADEGAAAAAPADDLVERMAAAAAREFEFAAGERFVRRPLPTLDIINEKFVRNLRAGLFQLTRRSSSVEIGTIEVQRFADFLQTVGAPTNFNIVGLAPLRGNGLVVCEARLISLLVDSLYGGGGKLQAVIEGRDFSPTEQRVIQRLVNRVCGDYGHAWKDVYPLAPALLRTETHAQFVNVAAPAEMVLVTTVTIGFGEQQGVLRLALPYAAFEPIRELLYGAAQAQAIAEDRRWLSLLTREIQSAEITLAVELAAPELTVGQLLAMKPGDFIQFDRPASVVAAVDGAPVFAGVYGTHNARYALRIEECLGGAESHWLGASHVA